MKRLLLVLAAGAAALYLASCKHSPPADVAAEVNGHAITMAELDKTYQSNAQQAEGASEDQIMAQKIDLLSSMIIQEINLQRAEKLGLAAVDADVDGEIAKMRAPYTKEEFEKQLAAKHMTLNDLKAEVRSRLTVDKLVNKEITSKITIRSEEHTSELQSPCNLVCRLLLEKKTIICSRGRYCPSRNSKERSRCSAPHRGWCWLPDGRNCRRFFSLWRHRDSSPFSPRRTFRS